MFKQAGALGYIEGSHLLDRAGSYEAPLLVPTSRLLTASPREFLFRLTTRASSLPFPPSSAPSGTHLKEKGWDTRYFQHVLDEAHGNEPPYHGRFAALVHQQMPGIPTLDAIDAENLPEVLQKNCDVWVPQLGRFDGQMPLLKQRIGDGHAVWFYTCLYPQKRYLNRLMDLPLIKVRLLQWLDFRYGFTGFLHWGGDYWTPKPLLDTQAVIDDNAELLPSGDAFVVYPRPRAPHRAKFDSIRSDAREQRRL